MVSRAELPLETSDVMVKRDPWQPESDDEHDAAFFKLLPRGPSHVHLHI